MAEPEKPFAPPRISLNRIYTRRGDTGETSLAGGEPIWKDAARIDCFGTVDELNAFTGLACVTAEEAAREVPQLGALAAILRRVQHELFNLGSILATRPEQAHPKQARITAADVAQLERDIDAANEALAPLSSFVLPGGCRLNAELHACRTICRRAERLLVRLARQEPVPPETLQYLNRLSDAFFVWSRWASAVLGRPEVLWDPNLAAGAR